MVPRNVQTSVFCREIEGVLCVYVCMFVCLYVCMWVCVSYNVYCRKDSVLFFRSLGKLLSYQLTFRIPHSTDYSSDRPSNPPIQLFWLWWLFDCRFWFLIVFWRWMNERWTKAWSGNAAILAVYPWHRKLKHQQNQHRGQCAGVMRLFHHFCRR